MKETGAFHVVRKAHNGKTTGYEVYCNNVPCIKSFAGQKLNRREARRLTDMLNREIGIPFRDQEKYAA